jgi:hypothetical protein
VRQLLTGNRQEWARVEENLRGSGELAYSEGNGNRRFEAEPEGKLSAKTWFLGHGDTEITTQANSPRRQELARPQGETRPESSRDVECSQKCDRNRSRACWEVTSLNVRRSQAFKYFRTVVPSSEVSAMKTVPTGFSSVPPLGPAIPVTANA